MSEEKGAGCPPGGCMMLQLSTQELRQKMEFMADNLITAVEKATQCLNSFNEGHSELKDTLAEFNTTVQLHQSRLVEGDRRFGSVDRRAHSLEKQQDQDHEMLILLDARVKELQTKPDPKLIPSLFGAGAGGACYAAIEYIMKALEMMKS